MITVIKTVQFDLTTNNDSGIITMPDLLDKSYVRAHISKLFCELEKNGLGQHVVGTRGRGQCEHFIKNEKTPDNFILHTPLFLLFSFGVNNIPYISILALPA